MKHKRFEENILVDEAYTNYGKPDKNEDRGHSRGIAKNFAESLDYDEKKKWFHQLPEEPSSSRKVITPEKVEELRKEANSCLHGDTMAYETKSNRSGSTDHQWAKTLLNKGAIGDRVAAATILIQDNPVHNLTALRNLVNSVKPAKKKDGIVIIDALSELLVSDLLIPDVKLRTFEQHPLTEIDTIASGNKQARRNVLKLWYYEDQLKELYGTYVEALNKFAHDSVEANKEKAVSAMSYLLMHHPEREKMLLSNIINKLGDPSQGVASKVIYHLCQLLFNHPNMKSVVLAEIEKMLFRTNISSRAQYYAICFLNQFFLGKDDSKIAENLIRIYFSFFKASIKKGEIDSRLMAAILTGVKRAYPFCDPDRLTDLQTHMEGVYKLVHMSTLHISVLALALLCQTTSKDGLEDRFYSALYRKLINVDIYNTSHSALLFSLIFKAMKQDKNTPRLAAFTKRLLQVCCYLLPSQAVAILFLLSQVMKDGGKKEALRFTWTKRDVKEEQKQFTVVLDDTQESNSNENVDATAESIDDSTVQENKEEVKEFKKIDLLRGDKKDLILDDDEEESYVDLKIDHEGKIKPKKKHQQPIQPGWHHARVGQDNVPTDTKEREDTDAKIMLKRTINMDKVIKEYNPLARNPTFAGADQSAYIELTLLVNHFHPTVKLFADKFLNEQLIQYTGDPIKDFSGIRFLDRFVFKNPKKRNELQQDDGPKKVKGSHPKFAVRKNYNAKGIRSIPINSASYLNEDVAKIPVDERFLYDYLQKRRAVKADSDSDDSDNDSVTSEDFESYLDSITGTHAKADSDEELDFLSEMEATKKSGKKVKDDNDDMDGDDKAVDDLSGDDESDGELNIEGSDEELILSADEDELAMQGDSDDDSDNDMLDKSSKKSKKNKLKLKGSEDLGSLFASAEEFSTLLEDTATNKKQGSSHAVSNTDNSSQKQLAWEEKRDRWMSGFNKKVLGNKKGSFKRKHSSNKSGKQNGGFKMADKKKGGKRKGGAVNVGGKKQKK